MLVPDLSLAENQARCVEKFEELVSFPFQGKVNAVCWSRQLKGDFSEIVNKVNTSERIYTLGEDELRKLELSKEGDIARQTLLSDLQLLDDRGASPILNLIQSYERDESSSLFPTDVYSFHVDRAPVSSATYLCTYHGDSSEILPNSQGTQKILLPHILKELKQLYDGEESEFDTFLRENFFDLHFEPQQNAKPYALGLGHLWKLAIDHPDSETLPCIHRAPMEKSGLTRLMLIC